MDLGEITLLQQIQSAAIDNLPHVSGLLSAGQIQTHHPSQNKTLINIKQATKKKKQAA